MQKHNFQLVVLLLIENTFDLSNFNRFIHSFIETCIDLLIKIVIYLNYR